jgi:hypothetical protein
MVDQPTLYRQLDEAEASLRAMARLQTWLVLAVAAATVIFVKALIRWTGSAGAAVGHVS